MIQESGKHKIRWCSFLSLSFCSPDITTKLVMFSRHFHCMSNYVLTYLVFVKQMNWNYISVYMYMCDNMIDTGFVFLWERSYHTYYAITWFMSLFSPTYIIENFPSRNIHSPTPFLFFLSYLMFHSMLSRKSFNYSIMFCLILKLGFHTFIYYLRYLET